MFEMEKRLRWSKMKVGLVVTLALLTLFLAVFFAGNIELLFSPKVDLRAQFQDVKGLRKGAPVWVYGTEVGSVKDITLDPIYGTIVTVSVAKNIQGLIKKDSQASILTMGMLGDKYVELTPGSPLGTPIKPGEILKGVPQIELTDIVALSGDTIETMGDFLKKLDTLIDKIEKGQGTLAHFINDPTVYNNLAKSTQALTAMVEDIRSSRGTLKMLIEDPSIYNKMLAASSSIEGFSKKLNESTGTLQKLVENPELYDRLVAATSSIEAFTKKFNEGQGTIKKLVEDPELYDRLVAATTSLEAFTKKLNEGQGTIKKLVEDPELYENLRRASQNLSSIFARLDRGEGIAGAFVRDTELAMEFKETLIKFRSLTVEAEKLAAELEKLTKDIKENPRKYFKFSVF